VGCTYIQQSLMRAEEFRALVQYSNSKCHRIWAGGQCPPYSRSRLSVSSKGLFQLISVTFIPIADLSLVSWLPPGHVSCAALPLPLMEGLPRGRGSIGGRASWLHSNAEYWNEVHLIWSAILCNIPIKY
jgi:hypothetical protein